MAGLYGALTALASLAVESVGLNWTGSARDSFLQQWAQARTNIVSECPMHAWHTQHIPNSAPTVCRRWSGFAGRNAAAFTPNSIR
jgi:hypothetical protein